MDAIKIVCANCRTTFFVQQDEQWKKLCLTCYKEKKGYATNRFPGPAALPDIGAQELKAARCEIVRLNAKIVELNGSIIGLLESLGHEMSKNRNAIHANQHSIMNEETLKLMRILCHPDKHSGSRAAVKITTLLNEALSENDI